jgi:hypothetical protein
VKETVAVLMAAASEIIFDSDSSDSSDSDSPSGAITLAGFAEEVVPMFSDIEFRSHFEWHVQLLNSYCWWTWRCQTWL